MNQQNDRSFPGIWEELKWRGLIHDTTDPLKLQRLLNTESITFYSGFDPTAASLHVGNLVQLLLMRRLQLAGHKPIALLGGSTGLIGDPRPSAERTLNTPQTVAEWTEKLEQQVRGFLPVEGSNGLRTVNNLDWFGQVSALDFLRDFGKFFRVSSMLKRDAVKSRLESDAGISFTEFSYQILQASDFLELFRTENCVLQTGGSDQWGNIIGGVELVKKTEGVTVHALVAPLILNSDGTKFGKSEGNAVWLNPDMTSPFAFFQFWLNVADTDVINRLKQFTFLTQNEIQVLEAAVKCEPHKREAQRVLAREVTSLVHGRKAMEEAEHAGTMIFSDGDFFSVSPEVLNDVVQELTVSIFAEEKSVGRLLVSTGLVTSFGAAQRLIAQNGVSVNNHKLVEDRSLSEEDFIHGRFLFLRKGKKQLVAVLRT